MLMLRNPWSLASGDSLTSRLKQPTTEVITHNPHYHKQFLYIPFKYYLAIDALDVTSGTFPLIFRQNFASTSFPLSLCWSSLPNFIIWMVFCEKHKLWGAPQYKIPQDLLNQIYWSRILWGIDNIYRERNL